jgi:hypothetical protein
MHTILGQAQGNSAPDTLARASDNRYLAFD